MEPRDRRRLALVLVPVLAASGLLALYRGQDPFARNVLRYVVWRKLSPHAGGAHYADVNGVRLYFEDHGAGPPVLVLHGGFGFVETMGSEIRSLARQHRVIAVDSRGHGRSTNGPPPLRYETMADDMIALLDRLGVDRFDVVGWSDGGNVALALAMAQPERVGHVVAIGANARADGLTDESRSELEMPPDDAEARAGPPSLDVLFTPKPREFPLLRNELREMWLGQPQWSDDDLARIRARTLLLVGEHDAIKPEHTQEMAAAIPGARVETVAGATHGLPLERPKWVAARIAAFLAEP